MDWKSYVLSLVTAYLTEQAADLVAWLRTRKPWSNGRIPEDSVKLVSDVAWALKKAVTTGAPK